MEKLDTQPVLPKGSGKITSINSIFMLLLVVVVVIGLLVAGLSLVGQLMNTSSTSARHAEDVAVLLADSLSEAAAGHKKFVKALSSDTHVAQLLADGDYDALNKLAEKLAKQSSEVIKVRYLPKEHNEKDSDPVVPLSFSSLDLAHRSEKSVKVPDVEIHAPNSPAQHIALASAVRNKAGLVVGVVHVAVSPQPLFDIVNKLPAETGSVTLIQSTGSDSITLARSPAYQDTDDASGKVKIENTIWTLGYQPVSPGSILGTILPAMIILIGTVLVSVILFLKKAQLLKAVKRDHDNIMHVVESKLKGKGEHLLGNYALADNKELIAQLSQLEVTATGKVASKKQQTAEGDEQVSVAPAFPSKVSQGEETATDVEDIEGADISAEIFREYDIRGVVGDTLNLEQAYVIGRAIGSLAIERGEFNMLVARDGRVSSKDLSSTLIRGLSETGINVIDLGMMPTPVMYFGTHFLSAKSGVMVTGSHNPADYNGFKIVLAGEALKGDEIRGLHQRIVAGQFSSGDGSKDKQDISPDYIKRITEDVQLLKPMKIVVDCGHGVASVIARSLFEALGCDVTTLYCEVDGKFPNHHPDPGNPENMKELAETVKAEDADLGIAFDGDGDRLGVVDSSGKQIMPDRVLMLLAADMLLRNPGEDVIYDVKSTKHLAANILSSGGRPIMWKSGHSLMKAKMKETGALLGGEFSGHIFFMERWYGFDDALYAAARLLEVISGDGRYSSEIFAELPDSINTPELSISVPEGMQHQVMDKLQEAAGRAFPNAKVIDIDGIRAEYPGAWGLIRASNTTPALVLRFEADNEEALAKVQGVFRTILKAILPNATIPF